MPDEVTIYHNPRCSKSRQTLELLRERGVETEIVEYLTSPPSRELLRELLRRLGMRPADLLRRGESLFAELGLEAKLDDDEAILGAMAEHPILIERPIVVRGSQARVGRPPETVLDIV